MASTFAASAGIGTMARRCSSWPDEVVLAQQSPQIIDALARALAFSDMDPVPLLRRALVQYPQDYNLHFRLGNHAADPQEQIGSLRAALAVRPDSGPARLNLSICLKEKGDMEGAIALCRKAIDIDPGFNKPHFHLGNLLEAEGDLDAAIASYKQAVKVDPRYFKAIQQFGHGAVAARRPGRRRQVLPNGYGCRA